MENPQHFVDHSAKKKSTKESNPVLTDTTYLETSRSSTLLVAVLFFGLAVGEKNALQRNFGTRLSLIKSNGHVLPYKRYEIPSYSLWKLHITTRTALILTLFLFEPLQLFFRQKCSKLQHKLAEHLPAKIFAPLLLSHKEESWVQPSNEWSPVSLGSINVRGSCDQSSRMGWVGLRGSRQSLCENVNNNIVYLSFVVWLW